MTKLVHDQKIIFASTLRPFVEMLAHQKRRMDLVDWREYVNRVVTAIINNPEQYLGQNLPSKELTSTLVLEIFDELTQGVLFEITE